MAEKFIDVLMNIHNTEIRQALEKLYAMCGLSKNSTVDTGVATNVTGDVTGNLTGNVTGDVIGDLTGNVTGDVTGNVTGDLTGKAKQINAGDAPVNAVASQGTLTISGVVIDGETFTVDGEVLEFDADGSYTGTQVDISSYMTKSYADLTLTGVAVDAETITLNGRVYEFDAKDAANISGDVAIDINQASGYTTKAQGTLTVAATDVHDETIVVDGNTHTLKADGTAGSASVIDISGLTGIVAATAVFGLGGPVADTETVTINGRVYEFDSGGGITGDVAIDVSGGLDVDNALTAMETAINGDGSAIVTAVKDLATNTITLTSIIKGTPGNAYTTAETCANGGFQTDQGAGGTFTDGANPTAVVLGAAVLAHFQGAGAEANAVATAGATADKIVFTHPVGGTAGNAITTTETLTGGSFDAATLGTTTAGVDCSAANAVTAIVAAIVGDGSAEFTATDEAGDVVRAHWLVPGTVGDGKVTAEAMANASWSGNTANGADCSAADAVTALAAVSPRTNVSLADGAGDTVVVTALVAGTAGDAITLAESMANGAVDAATLGTTTAGVDGTVGLEGELRYNVAGGFVYLCLAANTIADANWRRWTFGAVY